MTKENLAAEIFFFILVWSVIPECLRFSETWQHAAPVNSVFLVKERE